MERAPESIGTCSQSGNEALDHLLQRNACRRGAGAHRRHDRTTRVENRDRDRSQSDLELLIGESVATGSGVSDGVAQRNLPDQRIFGARFDFDTIEISQETRISPTRKQYPPGRRTIEIDARAHRY